MHRGLITITLLVCAQLPIPGMAQNVPDLSGMWSDPPPRAEDAFCHVGCTIEGRNYLTQILDDPANIDRPYAELREEAEQKQLTEIIPSHLTPVALESFPMNRSAAPLSTACDPWGFTRQVLAPHAFEITQHEDRVSFYYSEWTARRTIFLDGRKPPADFESSLLGFSVGHYEGDTLVVETIGINANFSNAGFAHSDQLSVTERYTRVDDRGGTGNRLEVEAILQDPVTFQKPLHMGRAWTWAPSEEIYPYESCIVPSD